VSCITPYTVKLKIPTELGTQIPVPCGKCPFCLKRRVSGWSFRLMQEDKSSISSLFITLTYDTQHVPISDCGRMTLNKKHTQLFWKRLRKASGKNHKKILYYICGEYGTKTFRPHYHAIVFNANIDLIQAAWDYGNVHFGTVSEASVGYTLKYMSKPPRIPMYKADKRLPEFSLMSKGIGKGYITDATIKYHNDDFINKQILTLPGGQLVSMPRYYRKKIFTEQQNKTIAFHSAIKHKALEAKAEKEWKIKHGENSTKAKVEAHKTAFRRYYKKALEGRNTN